MAALGLVSTHAPVSEPHPARLNSPLRNSLERCPSTRQMGFLCSVLMLVDEASLALIVLLRGQNVLQ